MLANHIKHKQRFVQSDINELRADLQAGEASVLGKLQELISHDYEQKARKSLARLSAITWEIEHDPEQMAEIKQDMAEAPYRSYQAIAERQEAKRAAELQRARNTVAGRSGWW